MCGYEQLSVKSVSLSFGVPASSGPGMNKKRLCSFNLDRAAIISPSFPNCNLSEVAWVRPCLAME